MSDSPFQDYANDTDATIALRTPLDLRGLAECTLVFYVRYELEAGYDWFSAEVRGPGDTSWRQAGESITGSSDGAWHVFTASLGAYEGLSDVGIRFRLRTDESVTADGVHLDGVCVHCDKRAG
jgi:hypothetical protein